MELTAALLNRLPLLKIVENSLHCSAFLNVLEIDENYGAY